MNFVAVIKEVINSVIMFNALLEYGLRLGLGLGRGRLSTKDFENCCEFRVLKGVKVKMTEFEFDEQLTVSQFIRILKSSYKE